MLVLHMGPKFHVAYGILSDHTGVIAAGCR